MAMKTIGILDSTLMGGRDEEMRAFYNGLAGTGRNGSNTSVCHKWADNDYTQLGPLAQQLIDLNVSVIVAAGGPASAIAAQVKTTTIPIVFTTITDPRPSGLVRNLDAPEANVTGTFGHTTDLDDERLVGLNVIAKSGPIGILCNPQRPFPRNPDSPAQRVAYRAKADAADRQAIIVDASTEEEITGAFNYFHESNIQGLLVSADGLFNSHRRAVIALADHLDVPAMYQWPRYVRDGGLMSFGPTKTHGYRNAGEYAGHILNGRAVGHLPVLESKMREFSVNSKAALKLTKVAPEHLDTPFLPVAHALGVDFINWI